jgi:cytochrome bd-type quinol oxidase subunit 2
VLCVILGDVCIFVLCFTAVPPSPGKTPFAVQFIIIIIIIIIIITSIWPRVPSKSLLTVTESEI